MLKYLRRKERLDWMKDLQVMEAELIAEAQSEVLANLMGATELDWESLLLHLLGEVDSYEAAMDDEMDTK